jgi:hypothetical protein
MNGMSSLLQRASFTQRFDICGLSVHKRVGVEIGSSRGVSDLAPMAR